LDLWAKIEEALGTAWGLNPFFFSFFCKRPRVGLFSFPLM
jgi:hypothetical protein